jgi:predicted nucleic acid-binding protein
MTGLAVIDSSVVHKWLDTMGEHRVDEAVTLLHRHALGDFIFVAPSLMPVEVTNSLRCKPHLTREDVTGLTDDLEAVSISLFDVTYSRLRTATELAYRHKLSVYDALFLQLAEELDCPLITADRRAFVGIDSPVEIRLL